MPNQSAPKLGLLACKQWMEFHILLDIKNISTKRSWILLIN